MVNPPTPNSPKGWRFNSRSGEPDVKPRQRQARMLELIERAGEVTVDALAADFDVSAETIRRDLASLAENGSVQKVHGGARRMRLHAEGTFDQRMDEAAPEKAEIGRKLAQVITPGDTCFIDTGSTTLACAQALSGTADLTVRFGSRRPWRAAPARPGSI
jgi:DeoR family glycerol-3-phosphate regulon repressor